MDRTAGSSLIGLGVVIAVVGALLKYAVTIAATNGFNINTAGLILLVAGIVIFAIGLVVLATGNRRRVTIHEDVRTSPQGQYRVQQRDDLG
jgi:membrane-bound ClpP family serine protease